MKRFLGLIPKEDIKIDATYRCDLGYVYIQSNRHGWTIVWADYSCTYKDVETTAEENFDAALNIVKSKITIEEPAIKGSYIESYEEDDC